MSSTKQGKQAQAEEWRPQRTHAMFHRFRRGPDKKKRFVGQESDEVIRRVIREHPIFYIGSTWPFVLALIFLGLVSWIDSNNLLPGSLIPFLFGISAIAIVGTGLLSAYRIYELWGVNIDIVTNKRILTWHGLLNPMRDETELGKVQQIAVDQETLFQILLNYGLVTIYLAGGKALMLKKVRDPKGIRDDIMGIHQSYLAQKAAKAAPPTLSNPSMADTIEKLAKHENLPTLPDADAKYRHRRSPAKLRRPLRKFGGPLRIPCDVLYQVDEYSVMYIQRSRWVLAFELMIPALLLLACLVGALIASHLFGLFAIAFIILLVISGLIFINYVDDVFILTNKRIIDIDRRYIFFFEEHDETTYDKITKVEVKSPNVLLLALSIGNLDIVTPGNNTPDIHMRHIAHPFFIQDRISEIQSFKQKYDKARGTNERKDELNSWFSNVLSTLEQKVTGRGVPNLQSLDLWDAIARASEFGMKVIPIGESNSYPHVDSGKIVMQIPPPGTLMNVNTQNPAEKPQIQVILSKRS